MHSDSERHPSATISRLRSLPVSRRTAWGHEAVTTPQLTVWLMRWWPGRKPRPLERSQPILDQAPYDTSLELPPDA
jgi:hypothetical protein